MSSVIIGGVNLKTALNQTTDKIDSTHKHNLSNGKCRVFINFLRKLYDIVHSQKKW